MIIKVSNKRKSSSPKAGSSKRRTQCQQIIRESTLEGAYVSLSVDMTETPSPDIIVPECLMDEMATVIARMGHAKVQFGLGAEFIKDDGVDGLYRTGDC